MFLMGWKALCLSYHSRRLTEALSQNMSVWFGRKEEHKEASLFLKLLPYSDTYHTPELIKIGLCKPFTEVPMFIFSRSLQELSSNDVFFSKLFGPAWGVQKFPGQGWNPEPLQWQHQIFNPQCYYLFKDIGICNFAKIFNTLQHLTHYCTCNFCIVWYF